MVKKKVEPSTEELRKLVGNTPATEAKTETPAEEAPATEAKAQSKAEKKPKTAEELQAHLKAALEKRFGRDTVQLREDFFASSKVVDIFKADFETIFAQVNQRVWYSAYDYYFAKAVVLSLLHNLKEARAWGADQIRVLGSRGEEYFTKLYNTPRDGLVEKELARAKEAGEEPRRVYGWFDHNTNRAADLLEELKLVAAEDAKFAWEEKGKDSRDWPRSVVKMPWMSVKNTIKALHDLSLRGKCSEPGCRHWVSAFTLDDGTVRLRRLCKSHFEAKNFTGRVGMARDRGDRKRK